MELRGDRAFRDDRAIICGLGRVGGQKLMLVGHSKGRDTAEKRQLMHGLLERVELSRAPARGPGKLPLGQRTRITLRGGQPLE